MLQSCILVFMPQGDHLYLWCINFPTQTYISKQGHTIVNHRLWAQMSTRLWGGRVSAHVVRWVVGGSCKACSLPLENWPHTVFKKNFILGETQEITWNASLSPHFALRVSRGSVMDSTLRLPLISDVAKWDLSKDEAFTEMKNVFNLRRGRDLMSLCVSITPTYVPTHIFYQFLYALYSQHMLQLLRILLKQDTALLSHVC